MGFDAAALAATLRATVADLDAHIQPPAAQLAAPRIAELQAEHAREQRRLEGFLDELRRQLKPLLADQDRLPAPGLCRPQSGRCWTRPGVLADR